MTDEPNKPDISSDGHNGELSHMNCGNCGRLLKVTETQVAADGIVVYYLEQCVCGIEKVRQYVRMA